MREQGFNAVNCGAGAPSAAYFLGAATGFGDFALEVPREISVVPVLQVASPPVVPVDWIIIGLLICSVVGVVFGTYPAFRAANLDPIESLRYE